MKGILSLEYLVVLALMLSLFSLFIPINMKIKEKSSLFIEHQQEQYTIASIKSACERAKITGKAQHIKANLSKHYDIDCHIDLHRQLILAS